MTELIPEPDPAHGDAQAPGPAASSVTSAPPNCPTRTRLYRAGRLVAGVFPPEQISEELAADPTAVVWLDMCNPTEDDLSIITMEFGLHPLAVEDAIHDHQRPKLDRYPSHLFATVYAATFNDDSGELATSEISAFITSRALITIRKSGFDVDTLLARWDASPELVSEGVGFLVHGLLDGVVDSHDRAIEEIDDAVDALEEVLFQDDPEIDIRRRGFELRKSLGQLRRVVAPMRELVGRLLHTDAELHLVTEQLTPYYQDVYDHVLRSSEGVESARDLIASILETNLTEQSNELNETTKRLAAWAAIIAVPTAVTGFYGQNVPYPGFGEHWGFLVSAIVIVGLSGGLYLLLRRNHWL